MIERGKYGHSSSLDSDRTLIAIASIAVLLTVCFSLLAISDYSDAGSTASGTCGDNLTWELNDGTLTISGTGSMKDYGWGNAPWYPYEAEIKSTIIGDGVTSIGKYAFYGCTGLTSVTIPNGVTSIGDYAFYGCTGLTSVTIPNSVTSIGDYAFYGCTSLESFDVSDDNTKYCSDKGVLFNKEKTELLQYPAGRSASSYTIPNSVTSIKSDAFYECAGLTSVTIPNGVTSIGGYAFARCTGLTSIAIPDSVTIISNDAFSRCAGLTSVTIPNSVTSIESRAFYECTGLTSVTIPNSVTSIGDYAFFGCTSLESFDV
ncbi:MAG: leucine-rich repeat domain-containing protein, partial [Candidatus Methanomethylophilaceae archaeon]|nr:leucine-rich repeat domain-containing protein [Candidatus Methanomethylophilaceae archaeon]